MLYSDRQKKVLIYQCFLELMVEGVGFEPT